MDAEEGREAPDLTAPLDSSGLARRSPWSGTRVVATGLCAYALIGGLVSFLGWALDMRRLTNWGGNGISIQPNSSVAAMSAAASLLCLTASYRRLAAVLGAFVALVGVTVLFEWVAGLDLGIDTLLMFGHEWGRLGVVLPGRIGPPAATSWSLLGLALALASTRGEARARVLVPLIALVPIGVSSLSLVGYLYGAHMLYSVPTATAIALQTATFIFAISVALVIGASDQEPLRLMMNRGPAGALLRRIVPAVVVVPVVFGFIRVIGERRGLYDSAFGSAVRTLSEVALLLGLLWWTGDAIRREAIRRTEAHAALRASEQRLKDTLENVNDGFVTLDGDWRYTDVNAEAERLIGRSRSELIGRRVWEIFPEAKMRKTYEVLQRVASSRVAAEFEDFNPVLGRWFANKAYPIKDAGVAVYFQDITLRREAAETVQRSQEQLAADLAIMTQLQAVSTQLVRADDAEVVYEKILDAAATVLGAEFASMQILHPERGAGGELALVAFRGFPPEAAGFWKWVRVDSSSTCGRALRDGERVVVPDVQRCESLAGTEDLAMYLQAGIRSVQSTPLVSRRGTTLGMLSTHWKAPHEPSERDLRYFDLLARMAADVIERSQQELALRDADRRKDEFLALLAHELRNPLAPIRTAVELMKLDGSFSPRLVRARDVIDRQVSQMTRLMDDLLDAGRIATGKLELRKQRVDLGAVIAAAVETCAPLVESSRHDVTVSLPNAPVLLDADPVRLTQVFGNLLNNACKYTMAGGRIEITAREEGADAVVTIRDNGIGIPKSNLPNIFELFSRGGTAINPSAAGLGIGLHLVRRLVEMHGGTVTAFSEGPDLGSELVVRLPVAVAEGTHRVEESDKVAAGATRRILVVDDNEDAANGLAELLEAIGNEAVVAHDGPQALEKAQSYVPDVVLLDIGLPNMNGYEVCRRLRKQSGNRRVVIVAVTGWGQSEDRRKSAEAGFDGHLVKPVTLASLQAVFASS